MLRNQWLYSSAALKRLDRWITSEGAKSRPEAIRRLIEKALSGKIHDKS
jgi:hypothetical protein